MKQTLTLSSSSGSDRNDNNSDGEKWLFKEKVSDDQAENQWEPESIFRHRVLLAALSG